MEEGREGGREEGREGESEYSCKQAVGGRDLRLDLSRSSQKAKNRSFFAGCQC